MIHNAQLLSLVALLVALSALGYYRLRNTAPVVARNLLSAGGFLAGSFFAVTMLWQVTIAFRHGWNLFGLSVWGAPVLFVGGGIAGCLAVLWWTAVSPAKRRVLKIALVSTLLLTPAVLFILPIVLQFVIGRSPSDSIHDRSIAITDFAASAKSAVFRIPMRDNAVALVFVDRVTRQARLIGENGYRVYGPSFSRDGERLLFVRSKNESQRHELISCIINTWQCRPVLQTDNDVVSPVEIKKDTILYASSPLIVLPDRKRYSRHDFYSIVVGSDPVRLSDIELLGLHSISPADDRILFGAVDLRLANPSVSRSDNKLPHSEIFEVAFDRNAPHINASIPALNPRVYVGGYSVFPSLSEDGRLVAFLNAEFGKGPYRFNLIVVDGAERLKKRIDLEGLEFSRPAFAGHEMLYNELFNDRYRVRAWNASEDSVDEVFQIEFSKLKELDRVKLLFLSP
ncbi:MAG: hypothetical protein PSV22_16490 [Pseudolabrys sp.]|nr:hypothetical protein [Pseudolabrys sp.]